MSRDRALGAMEAAGVPYRLIEHGPVSSLAEAAAARGVEPCDVVKSIVVRRAEGEYLVVLVPGDRTIAWPRLRKAAGSNRMAMPPADEALAASGYARGTITPFGTGLPVIADTRIAGRVVTLGAGEHGIAVALDADAAIAALGAQVADVTDPEA